MLKRRLLEKKRSIPANCQIWHYRANHWHDRASLSTIGTLDQHSQPAAQPSKISDRTTVPTTRTTVPGQKQLLISSFPRSHQS
ncbi:hypothetical protein Hanom_Chr05g00439851 [Helianthus anomalus]